MMTLKLQIVIGFAIVVVFGILVNMIRKRSLELKYALSWMAVLCALLLFDCWPGLLIVVSEFLGIYAPVNSIRTLDQTAALNEKRLQELEAELKKAEERQEG